MYYSQIYIRFSRSAILHLKRIQRWQERAQNKSAKSHALIFHSVSTSVKIDESFSFDTRVFHDGHRQTSKRDAKRENKFLSKISRRMEIGHGAGLSVTVGSVPANLHLSSKGLFFMFELNCLRQRALSTLAEVMIAILKRELADVSTNFELRWLSPTCFVSTLFNVLLPPPPPCFVIFSCFFLFYFSFTLVFFKLIAFQLPCGATLDTKAE